MKLAVLPFNAVEGTRPALARQIVNFTSDTVRTATGADINTVSYLTEIEEDGIKRAAFVNVADTLLERQWLEELFTQSGVDKVMDGLLKHPEGGDFEMTVRFHHKDQQDPIFSETWTFATADLFPDLQKLIQLIAGQAEAALPAELAGSDIDFGSENPQAFLSFLEGYDALMYIQQSNGHVAKEFSPEPAIASLLSAVEADPEFLAPYETLVQLARACGQFRVGTFEAVDSALLRLTELVPDDYKAFFALGEVHQGVNDLAGAINYYEKALALDQTEAALHTRLGVAQLASSMPVNAERNFRKAVEMEDETKPSLDFLAASLVQQNRQHEVPPLWKAMVESNPANPQAHAKYGIALVQAGNSEEGEKAFETGLATCTDNSVVKRYFAPYLVQKGDLDRAMDFYEDCIDLAPTDVELLLEYARTLQQAGREFEVPKVLQDVLKSTVDLNVRAQALAWLIELEQPKRAESVENARAKMESEDFEGAIRDLKPLRNWLADYWKMWALLSSAYNRLGQPAEAEEAARHLLELFPACEPAYGELASALNSQDRQDEAYSLMRFAAQNMPGSLPIHLNLALAAKRAGHQDEARALARQIREAVGVNEEVDTILSGDDL